MSTEFSGQCFAGFGAADRGRETTEPRRVDLQLAGNIHLTGSIRRAIQIARDVQLNPVSRPKLAARAKCGDANRSLNAM
jgi:hypothetical protein